MNTPIFDFLTAYAQKKGVRFHMPGHKGNGALGVEKWDITEIDGADVKDAASGIIAESEENARTLFQTEKTVFSTEGSTAAIKGMLALAMRAFRTQEKPCLLAARNAHRALLHASALLDLPITWMCPKNAKTVYSGIMCADEVEEAILSAKEKPFAVYITSPNYLGECWDIASVAKVCKKHSLPLLVDNAHGAYLAFLSPSQHPIHLGATMCADSAHKTLPVLTGGAYLHLGKEMQAWRDDAKFTLSLFSSSSPSYLTMASLDLANATLSSTFTASLRDTIANVSWAKCALKDAGFQLLPCEPLKIVLCDARAQLLSQILRKASIEPEFVDQAHIVLMASTQNTKRDFQALVDALLPYGKDAVLPLPAPKPHIAKRALSIKDALFLPTKTVQTCDALGEICAEASVLCPPAVPIAVCGEVIDEETVAALRYYGIEQIRVLKNKNFL